MAKKLYSVLLLYPDYLATQYGEETYFMTVKAISAGDAVRKVQTEAMADNSEYYGDVLDDPDHNPQDFAPLLVVQGRIKPLYGWGFDPVQKGASHETLAT